MTSFRADCKSAVLIHGLAAPSVTNPREPNARDADRFRFRFRFRLRVFLSAIVFMMRKYGVYDA